MVTQLDPIPSPLMERDYWWPKFYAEALAHAPDERGVK